MNIRNLANSQRYNLIVNNKPESLSSGKINKEPESYEIELDRDRLGECTATSIMNEINPLDENSLKKLKEYPCLFLYEKKENKDGFIGKITDIKIYSKTIKIKLTKSFEISMEEVENLITILDINYQNGFSELETTHWAIKNVNLLKVIASKNKDIYTELFGAKIFLSWSTKKSKYLAERFKKVLCDYLELNNSEVFISSKDISIGEDWWIEISSALKSVTIGIVFVTSENFNNPWLNYEAGILQDKLKGVGKLLPVSTQLDFSKINIGSCPLGKFQFANNIEKKEGAIKLIKTISGELNINENNNKQLGDLESWNDFHDFIIPSSQKKYNNFKEMLKFWVPKVRAEWNSHNNEKGYFVNEIRPSSNLLSEQSINYKQVEKEDKNFNSNFLNLLDKDKNKIALKFYDENGNFKSKYDSCLTWIPTTNKDSWFLKLVYEHQSDSLKVTYVSSKSFNKGDSQEFKDFMKNFNNMASVNVSKLELDKPGVNNEVKALYNHFLDMINYSKKA